MEINFESDQEYQLDAIASVTGLFEGQPRVEPDLILAEAGFAAVSNRIDLDDATFLANLRAVQSRNELPEDDQLQFIEQQIETSEGEATARFPNLSVEMETGTGKTYVYIRTALELFQRFGMRKFIVVVPSVAIREGVLKTLKITHTHLRELYGNAPYRFYNYDSDNLNIVRQFALSDGLELMVMTIDSFNKATNVINQSTDRLQGETPIHLVQTTRPVLILDEPQNMESELRVRALAALDPLLALRYSATHKNAYNLVYRLTPYEAYRQELVKRIEVAGVQREADANQVFMRLSEDGITTQRNAVAAKLTVHKLMANGTVKEKAVTLKPGDSLAAKTGLPLYDAFDIDEIIPGYGIRFTNDVEIALGESRGADKEAIFETQIRFTVEEHFRKQRRLRDKGIKVLSLFFIDRVDNYAPHEGVIRVLFEKAFDELKERYEEWRATDAAAVQGSYFAQRRRRSGAVEALDSTGDSKADQDAYDLIMREKERLLSFDEPTAFIFSHSALREGWDNPNVFQICTLNQSVSETKKRQEVGRGVRLAVNQDGDRLRDPGVNVLTVVANESYEDYVRQLQSEIEDEYGRDGLPPRPPNARKRGTAKLRKSYLLKPEFKELWERIRDKTRYSVTIDTARLLDEAPPLISATEIRPLRVSVRKGRLSVGSDDSFGAQQTTATRTGLDLSGRQPLPNLIDAVSYLLEQSNPPVRITRKTIFDLFKLCENQRAALANPHEWAAAAARVIREKLADQLVSGIQYEKINEWYEMTLFEDEVEGWADYLVPSERSLYDNVVFQSNVEKRFVEDMEAREDVKLYLKLPNWFRVPTPVGEYNPDWAIVKDEAAENGSRVQRIYLVAETKSTVEVEKLRPSEKRKVRCGQRHFEGALGVSYKVATRASEI